MEPPAANDLPLKGDTIIDNELFVETVVFYVEKVDGHVKIYLDAA